MPFDYKTEYKEFYLPKGVPQLVDIPSMKFVAIRGTGNPNDIEGEYQLAVGMLYAVSYTLKMSYKGPHKLTGYFEYVVPPLEGFWWQEGIEGFDETKKDRFSWISVIRVPEFVTQEDIDWAKQEVAQKKKMDVSLVQFLTFAEGLCVQCLHRGPYDKEPQTTRLMQEYIKDHNLTEDFSSDRLHHEIYLSDPRKSSPDTMKTVLRIPVRRL